jgi:hypothetical protein
MNDLISKSRLKNELLKIPSEMGLIEKAWVIQAVNEQKIQDSNNNCNCQHNSNSRDSGPCCGCDSGHTNADRIRNMSDEELVDFICSIETYEEGSIKTIENGVPMHTVTEVREWLQSEMKVKESEEK